MTPPKLEFFYYDGCPFCQIVLQVINEHNILVDYCNIQEDGQMYERLVKDTGRRTVPCLYRDGRPMHESSEIIDWINSNANDLIKRN